MEPTANREFRIVFQPNQLDLSEGRKRFLVGAFSLKNYIGKKNAETALKRAFSRKTDKTTIKFRKYGKCEIYVK